MIPQVNNPFVYNVPVVPANFVGRERTLALIVDHLRSSNRANIAVHGPVGVGKTSLLNFLADPGVAAQVGLDPDTFILCHIDCHSLSSFTPNCWWRRLLRCLARQLDGGLHETAEDLIEHGNISFEDIQDVLDGLERSGQVVIVLLDEFECLIRTHTDLSERTTRRLLGMLSSLGRRTPRVFSMVVATERPLAELSRDLEIWRGSPLRCAPRTKSGQPYGPSTKRA